MRQIVILAAVVLVGGGYAARFADRAVAVRPEAAVAAPAAPVPASTRSLVLDADPLGHFRADARIDGRRVAFIVDTGASLVALRASDAALAGIRPLPADYTATVVTANGKAKAARALLERIELGGITVFDVPVLVMPDDVLGENLLGVSFLSRLRRYEYAGGRMLLEQ